MKQKNDDVIIHACVRRKGNKEGSKLKKLSFAFPPKYASLWVASLEKIIFGGTISLENNTLVSLLEGQKPRDTRKCIFLIEKSDHKDAVKHIEKLMRPVFEAADKSVEIVCNQFKC